MAAGAKEIFDGGVGIIYIADILPGVLVKGSAAFWFDRVPYSNRLFVASLLMAACFFLVASSNTMSVQLLGVGCASLQSSLGEASLLAFASRIGGGRDAQPLTFWSSGTGAKVIFVELGGTMNNR